MEPLSLSQQKEIILHSSQESLWKILEEENAWVKLFKALPSSYYSKFLSNLKTMGSKSRNRAVSYAPTFIKSEVRLDDLRSALASAWNPDDLEDSTSWLIAEGLSPRGATKEDDNEFNPDLVTSALALSESSKERIARRTGTSCPKAGHPPAGCTAEAAKVWNSVLRDKKKKKVILSPASASDQFALAQKFWLRECAQRKIPIYVEESSSSSVHATNSLKRSLRDIHHSLCYDGYTMSRPASRILRQLHEQLQKDGYEIGSWTTIRPSQTKNP